ncbi:MAG: sortase [Clostridia bacterium]|nr:sortase [Clostridia bacterium]
MDELKNTPKGQEDQEEVLRLLHSMEKAEPAPQPEKPVADGEPTPPQDDREQRAAVDDLAYLLIDPYEVAEEEDYPGDSRRRGNRPVEWLDDEDEDLPPVPSRRNPFVVMWRGFRANLPQRGDTPGALVRKCAFLLALVVLIVSLGYILVDVVVLPMQNSQMYGELEQVYHPENSQVVTEGNYPEGMLASFRELYDRNDEVRGWISYHATGNKDFLNIEYPVMYSGDNDKYLTVDFDEKKNKNGALFFDMNNKLDTPDDRNTSLIIYGHNMASGQMFAGLNKFIGSVGNARAAAHLTMNTLYENNTYQVFAVLITDEDEIDKWYFNTRRTRFAGEEDFLGYVEKLRARSLFDYPVEVEADDELLVLSTCTAKSTAKVKDGRLVVVARKMQPGDAVTDTTLIQRNGDVIMPRYWYINQGLVLHEYYGGDHAGLTTTAPSGGTTTIGSGIQWPTTTTTGTGTDMTGTETTGTSTTGQMGGSSTDGTTTKAPAGSNITTGSAGATTAPTAGQTGGTDAPAATTAGNAGETTTATPPAEATTTGASTETETTATPAESTTAAQQEPTETTAPATEPTGEPVEGGEENTENQ